MANPLSGDMAMAIARNKQGNESRLEPSQKSQPTYFKQKKVKMSFNATYSFQTYHFSQLLGRRDLFSVKASKNYVWTLIISKTA